MEDFLYKFLPIYHRIPLPFKQLIGRVYNWLPRKTRYGTFFLDYSNRIEYFNKLKDNKEVQQKQWHLLQNHINNAINDVPYYKDYTSPDSIERFESYPIIDKKIILNSISDFINPKIKNNGIPTNTGGSSGSPLEFFLEKNVSRSKEKAHFDWYWGQFGYKPHDKILMARGLPLRNNNLFEYNTIDNILNVSCYNINEDNILLILNKINQFKPLFILAYPSSLKILTQLLEIHKDKLNIYPKAILLGSEHLVENDREYFEQFYKSKVVSWYGHSERLIHGGNCPYSNEYHFYPFYGYMELVDNENNIILKPGIEGRIIATGFDNDLMPFLRYDTGDVGVLSESTECKCGFKGTTLNRISGRAQDIIVLSDNTKVSLTAFIFGQHFNEFKKIKELQIVQHSIGKIELRIVKNSKFNKIDEINLLKKLYASVNDNLSITVNYVETLSKTHRGKNIFFISKLEQ